MQDFEKAVREANAKITEWVERALLNAPPEMQVHPDRCFLAIPTMIQRMMLRHWKRDLGSTKIGSFVSPDHRTVFSKLYGYTVVPGYEMAVVLFYADGAIDPENGIYRVEFEVSPVDKNYLIPGINEIQKQP